MVFEARILSEFIAYFWVQSIRFTWFVVFVWDILEKSFIYRHGMLFISTGKACRDCGSPFCYVMCGSEVLAPALHEKSNRAQRHPVALYEKSGITWSRSKHLYSASLAREAVQTFPRELVTAEHRRRMKNISEERTWADNHFESYEAGKTCSFIHPWFTSPHSTFCCQLSYFSPNLARKMKQLGRP